MLVNASIPSITPKENVNSTYVVVFNDDQNLAGAFSDQVTEFVSENNADILYRYNTINGVAITIPEGSANKLKELKNVKYIEKDITFSATLDKSTSIVGAPQVWDMGFTGKGVKVALIDTGIDAGHPDLKGKVVEWKDFINNKEKPYDDFGHGSHCAGIIAGSGAASKGKYKGVAPDVQFIGIKVLGKDGQGSMSAIVSGVDYAANSDADIISMSLGSDEHSKAVCDAVTNAVKKGKIVVCAAGNSGPNPKTIGCPSDNPYVITVGATDKADKIASFSSRGPCKSGCAKPDICAPGRDIISCRASGTNDKKAIDNYYISESGTSMACPMVSGSIALMVQKNHSLTCKGAKDILEKTARKLGKGEPNCDYGYGRINLKSAIDYMNGKNKPAPVPSPTVTPKPSPAPVKKPTPTPVNPGYPEYPDYPYPTYPGYPYPSYPDYPYPGYPYPGY